jgi:hypothetical protein
MNVKLIHAALDIFKPAQGNETLILRGVIDPQTLDGILCDSYQREVLSNGKIEGLKKALVTSSVPDIELGMRGERVRHVDKEKGEYILLDPVFVIDGFQRTSAARSLLRDDPKAQPRIGATVHFDTNFEWEKARFRILNQDRTKVSVNILLRNAQTDYKSVDMLGKLCQDSAFALHERVQWQQNKLRTEVISALTLCRVAAILHSKFGSSSSRDYVEIMQSLDKAMEVVGRTTMRDNVIDFYEIIDECFGLRKIVFTHGASQIKDIFLAAFAELLGSYDDFWKGKRLSVDRRLRLKIAKFPIGDPEVARLASSGGKAGDILYQLLLDHINSGKRKKRLPLDSESGSLEEANAESGPSGTVGR